MHQQHQDSPLPAARQGATGYETATQYPYLVHINRVFHNVNIHLADAKVAVRNSLQRWRQGGGGYQKSIFTVNCTSRGSPIWLDRLLLAIDEV